MSAISFYLLFLTAFAVPYSIPQEDYWKFVIFTPFLIYLLRRYKKSEWRKFAGFSPVDGKDIGLAVCLLLICGSMSYLAVPQILESKGILLEYPESFWKRLIHSPPHVLHEEILFRAILLRLLIQTWQKPLSIAALGALVFSVMHTITYGFIKAEAFMNLNSLLTLFFVGLSLNLIYLRSNSILIPVAIHLGWNFFRFSPTWTNLNSGFAVNQGESFNQIEGDPIVLGFSVIVLAIGLAYYRFRKTSSESVFHVLR